MNGGKVSPPPSVTILEEWKMSRAMRFVVCLDPMVRFLFQKSLPLLPATIASSVPVKRFLTNQVLEPADLRQLIEALTAVQMKLVEADQFYKIIVFRKYVGVPGLLRGFSNR